MIWNHFEDDRAALGTQYTEHHWDAASGLAPEALRTALKDAGIDEILTEVQAQYDEWKAAKAQ